MGRRLLQMTGTYILLFASLGFIGCERLSKESSEPPPPPNVFTSTPIIRSVVDFREYTGRTAAIESVEIRARVSGYLESVDFVEGKDVAEGDFLFHIDPRPYQQAVLQAEANLASQKAQSKRFGEDLSRASDLRNSNTISQAELDQAVAAANSAKAQLKALKAALSRAKLDLEYTQITSSISGRTSRAMVTPGNLVVADTTVLTNVVSMDPIYAYFDVDENSALDYRKRVRGSEVPSARETKIKVALGLANEEGHPHIGEIDFVDNVTDGGTGNIQVRGKFSNADGALLPGLFCRVRVPFTRAHDALLVPQTALAMNQQGRYLLVVNDEKVVETHIVEVGESHGNMVAIRSGIENGARVIVAGLQKARPGSVVNPIPAPSEAEVDGVDAPDGVETSAAASTEEQR